MADSKNFHSNLFHPTLRKLQESSVNIAPENLMYPLFLIEGDDSVEEIATMPGISRLGINQVIMHLEPLVKKGLKSVLLFCVINKLPKDNVGTLADSPKNPVIRALSLLSERFPDLLLATDVCFNEENQMDNDATIERLAEISLAYALHGAHIIAPSNMMDNRIKAIKNILRKNKLHNRVAVLSNAVEYASCFYGPFRDAARSAPALGDRKCYQFPVGSKSIAAEKDVENGADMLMVKLGMLYLDIVRQTKDLYPHLPLFIYQVSGEFAMLRHGAKNGTFDLNTIVMESLTSMRRAGADVLITYYTPLVLDLINNKVMESEHIVASANSNSNDRQDFEQPGNIFVWIAANCTDKLFDWMTIKELVVLHLTCKKLQQVTCDYFHRKYPMKCMKVTDTGEYHSTDNSLQPFTQNIRNLAVRPSTECLQFLNLNHNKSVVSIAFYDGEIQENDMGIIATILENVEIIEILFGRIDGEFYGEVLKYCKRIKQLVINHGVDECNRHGVENRWLRMKYPTLEHFHCSLYDLPIEDLKMFFQLNPNIQSFSLGESNEMLKFMLETGTIIDELHMEYLYDEMENEEMEQFQTTLTLLYERQQFKSLMVNFLVDDLKHSGWAELKYLIGAYIESHYDVHGSTKAIASLVHLKLLVLGIGNILSPGKARILSKALMNLEEIYIHIDSVHALTPFIRNSKKLNKIYVYLMFLKRGFTTKIKRNFVTTLNMHRMKLENACKTVVYLPDHAYVEMKCQSNDSMNCNSIEIKRSESHVLKHPFVATNIRRDIFGVYERFL